MLIDWFTVGAQVVNFLILAWLLKHFLYSPILDAIDARENRIADKLADADAKMAEAQEERDSFQNKNELFDSERGALLSRAREEAKDERQRLLNEARQAADALSEKRKRTLREETETLNEAIGRRAQQEVFAIARKALMDLAGTSLDARMSDVFIRRLQEMDDKTKVSFAAALKSDSNPARLLTAFDLPAEQRRAIQSALDATFSIDTPIRFETAPDLVSGIELTTNGHKLAWSIADYMVSMQKGVDDILLETRKPQPRVEVDAKQGAVKHGA